MNNNNNKYPTLNDQYIMRNWSEKTMLINFHNGEYFELTKEQVEVLEYCNGGYKLISISETIPHKEASVFIDNLVNDNILTYYPNKAIETKEVCKATLTDFPLT